MSKSRREQERPPIFITPEVVDAYENGTEAEFIALYQPAIRYVCGRMENWRHCRLPRCRRSRTCTGSHIPWAFHRNFPPCIASNELHQAWLSEHRLYLAELNAAYCNAGKGQGV